MIYLLVDEDHMIKLLPSHDQTTPLTLTLWQLN